MGKRDRPLEFPVHEPTPEEFEKEKQNQLEQWKHAQDRVYGCGRIAYSVLLANNIEGIISETKDEQGNVAGFQLDRGRLDRLCDIAFHSAINWCNRIEKLGVGITTDPSRAGIPDEIRSAEPTAIDGADLNGDTVNDENDSVQQPAG